jgi:glucose/arabinose dehydrogenase
MRCLRSGLALIALVCVTACGAGPAAAPTAEAPAAQPSAAPTAAKPAASPVASPSPGAAAKPTATAEAAGKPEAVFVGNTDGVGVYVRKTPVMSDRLRAYPDGTELTIIGDDVDADGQHWHHVKTPDGLEGYVPAMYTVESPP